MSAKRNAYRIGTTGSILTIAGVLLSGPLALLAVGLIQSQPVWESPEVFVAHYHRIQALPFYFGFILIAGSVLMIAAIHLLSEDRSFTLLALLFTAIASGLIFFNYLTQTTVIPALAEAYSPSAGPILAALSMSNPTSIAWAVEMWSYGFLGLGTWLAAGFFADGRLEKTAKVLFVLNGILSLIGALGTSLNLGWVLSPAGLASFGFWNLLYLVLALAFYRVLRRRQAGAVGVRFPSEPAQERAAA